MRGEVYLGGVGVGNDFDGVGVVFYGLGVGGPSEGAGVGDVRCSKRVSEFACAEPLWGLDFC